MFLQRNAAEFGVRRGANSDASGEDQDVGWRREVGGGDREGRGR